MGVSSCTLGHNTLAHETFHNLGATSLPKYSAQGRGWAGGAGVGTRDTRSSRDSALYRSEQPQEEAVTLYTSQSPAQNRNSNSKRFSTLTCSIRKASFTLFRPVNYLLNTFSTRSVNRYGAEWSVGSLRHNRHLAICRNFSEGRVLLLCGTRLIH